MAHILTFRKGCEHVPRELSKLSAWAACPLELKHSGNKTLHIHHISLQKYHISFHLRFNKKQFIVSELFEKVTINGFFTISSFSTAEHRETQASWTFSLATAFPAGTHCRLWQVQPLQSYRQFEGRCAGIETTSFLTCR